MKTILILALLSLGSAIATAQSAPSVPVISPGIRLAYSSGSSGGLTFGIELSAGYWNRTILDSYGGSFLGGVIGYDVSINGRGRLHLGAEATLGPVGIEAGPTLLFENGTVRLAPTITAFAGFVIMPFYSMTFPDGREAISEWGTYVKVPHRTDGGELVGF